MWGMLYTAASFFWGWSRVWLMWGEQEGATACQGRPPLACGEEPVGMSVEGTGRCACRSAVVSLRRPVHPTGYDVGFRRWATTWASTLDHCADTSDMNGAPLVRTPVTAPCRSTWGRAQAATPPGVAANSGPLVDVSSFYCELCSADGPSPCTLVLGALSSSPVHRALVLVLGTNIAVLCYC